MGWEINGIMLWKVFLGNSFSLSFYKAQQPGITRRADATRAVLLYRLLLTCSNLNMRLPSMGRLPGPAEKSQQLPPGPPWSYILCSCLSLIRISGSLSDEWQDHSLLSVPQIPQLQKRGNKTVYLKVLKG